MGMATSARRQLHIRIAGALGALLCLLLMAGCGGSSSGVAAEATAAAARWRPRPARRARTAAAGRRPGLIGRSALAMTITSMKADARLELEFDGSPLLNQRSLVTRCKILERSVDHNEEPDHRSARRMMIRLSMMCMGS